MRASSFGWLQQISKMSLLRGYAPRTGAKEARSFGIPLGNIRLPFISLYCAFEQNTGEALTPLLRHRRASFERASAGCYMGMNPSFVNNRKTPHHVEAASPQRLDYSSK